MGKNKVGPKNKKGGSGMIGMGRSDLSRGGGQITRKIQSTEDIQKRADLASKKTLQPINRPPVLPNEQGEQSWTRLKVEPLVTFGHPIDSRCR